ncbi:hypothetical protein KIF24_24895 [Micromonospora sp. Llam7]|uniref:hypothetical protein n=1 Tax=Micromonospora tarapacensis TaxID=2835305 RepID=UPI001C82C154|nr:hypothetical protein [Micromonospora tarapacensis]MBX7268949.1 hypothetical protein [Micromonospora tarapacensis]
MNDHSSRLSADLRWVEAMLANLQQQIDQLAGELRALDNLLHAHTLASLGREPAADAALTPDQYQETDDGR